MTQQPPEFEPPASVPPPPPPTAPAAPGAFTAPPPPAGGAVAPRTDGMAIASLICSFGILVFSCFGIVTSILAVVFAKKAERNIANSGGQLGGEGLAKAGKIIGWIGIGLWAVGVVFLIVLVIISATTSNSNSSLGILR